MFLNTGGAKLSKVARGHVCTRAITHSKILMVFVIVMEFMLEVELIYS